MFGRKSTASEDYDAYQALRIRDFRFLISANFLNSLATTILSIVIGYELYQRTGSALALGMVGLVQITPNVVLSIPAGQLVDRFSQKRIAILALSLNSAAAMSLAILTWYTGPLALIYGGLFVFGVGRAFLMPTRSTLIASIVAGDGFGNAAAWSSSANQTAMVLGPAFGGGMVALLGSAAPVFGMASALMATAAFLMSQLRPKPITRTKEKITKESLFAGIRFIRSKSVLLAAITLDMVAVLLGGATALLPIIAEEVLHVDAAGLGMMRAAIALGAVVTSMAIAHRGAFRAAGPTLLLAVAGFGLATIVLGLSRSFVLSLGALAFLGIFDSISVVIRSTLQLTLTPDYMRGRVSAINFVFIGMSNEFGEFESGVMAALLGVTAAVIVGGVGTILVVPLIALAWPEIWRLREIKLESDPEVVAVEPAVQIARG